jgi:ribosomal protein S18 acetylase RimI-like enzyme
VRALAPGVLATLRELDGEVSFDYLGVPAAHRGLRVGDRAIALACTMADAAGLRIVMQPDSGFGSDLRRLARWYSRHGFTVVPRAEPFTMRRQPAGCRA